MPDPRLGQLSSASAVRETRDERASRQLAGAWPEVKIRLQRLAKQVRISDMRSEAGRNALTELMRNRVQPGRPEPTAEEFLQYIVTILRNLRDMDLVEQYRLPFVQAYRTSFPDVARKLEEMKFEDMV